MGLPVEGKAGPQVVARGDIGPLQKSVPFGNLTVQDGGARFEAAVQRGNVYGYCDQAGATTQAGLSASCVTALYNPVSSNVVGRLWYAGAIHIVACAAAATTWLCMNSTAVTAVTQVTTGTLATAQRNLLSGNPGKPTIQVLTTATLPAAPVGVAILGAGLTGAISTIPSIRPMARWFDGCIFIQPGVSLSIQTSTASGTSGMLTEWIWEEVPMGIL